MPENTIQYVARFKIRPGRVEEFKRVAQQCVQIAKDKEPGTLDYRWFMDDRGRECVIQQAFTNPQGILDHLNGEIVTSHLPRLLEASKLRSLEVYGEPRTPEVRRALDNMDAKYFGPALGFTHLKAEPATQRTIEAELAVVPGGRAGRAAAKTAGAGSQAGARGAAAGRSAKQAASSAAGKVGAAGRSARSAASRPKKGRP